MDLPTCPHCGESVLDDDVDECPFCGESMSAKPAGKKPSKPQPKPAEEPIAAKAETKPSTKRPAQKPKPAAEKASSGAEEPFAVDQAAMSNAIPLRPKPTKGRTYKVVCPMCETEGYTSPKAGGREVKCANPKCLVPIFTCPEPPPAPVEEPPPEPGGLSTTQLGMISVVALIAIGAGIWFFVLKDTSEIPERPAPERGVADTKTTDDPNAQVEPLENKQQATEPAKPQGPNLAQLRQAAPEIMIETSKWPSGRRIQRPKPLRIQGIALAYADLGELQKAEEQLERLSIFSDDSPHYRVLPWVEIGWKRREREESATDAADKALQFAADISKSNHESWIEAVSLGALLTALDRSDEARPLFERNFGPAADQELWADMMAVSLDHTFNIDAIEPVRPLVPPNDPAWSGVVWQLVFHDASASALDWAKSQPKVPARGEAIVGWAEAVVARSLAVKQPADYAGLDAALKELPQPWSDIATARAYSRIGQRYALAGDQTKAEEALQKAVAALGTFPQKSPMPEPDLRTIYEGQFPRTPFNTRMAATAFEVARLQSRLNKKAEAWTSIQQGLEILRSEALPESTATRLADEVKPKTDTSFVKARLGSVLSLDSEEKIRQAFRTYQTNVNDLKEQADARLNLQAELLSKAAEWGLAERVAQEILDEPTDRPRDSYFKTDLPWVVLHAHPEKASNEIQALSAALRQQRVSKPKGQALLENTARWMQQGEFSKVVDALGRSPVPLPDHVRKRWILRLCTQQVKEGQTDEVLSFLLALFNLDPFLGEDAAELIVAFATEQGQGDLIWQELKTGSWSATQRILAYKGFIEAATPLVEEIPSPQKSE